MKNDKLRFIMKILCLILAIFILIQLMPTKDATPINPFMKNLDNNITVATVDGCGDVFPKNVLTAFSSGVSMGCGTFYVNVCMTLDEVLVVSNSTDLSQVSNGTGDIGEVPYEDISGLNFAYNYVDEDGVQLYKSKTVSPVMLSDLLSKYKYADYIIKIVQTGKQGRRATEVLCELIRSLKISTQVIVDGTVDELKVARNNKNVNLFTCASESEQGLFKLLSVALMSNLYFDINFQAVFIDADDLGKVTTYLYMWALRSRNVCVYVKDINDEDAYNRAALMGVDGVITSRPDIVLPLAVTKKAEE